jgi:DNA-binding transcriptional MerR regulator
MIRIGDFSKLSRVSVKTLRYYDEMGLLKLRETARGQVSDDEDSYMKNHTCILSGNLLL